MLNAIPQSNEEVSVSRCLLYCNKHFVYQSSIGLKLYVIDLFKVISDLTQARLRPYIWPNLFPSTIPLRSTVYRRLQIEKMNTKPGADRWSSHLSVSTRLQMVKFVIIFPLITTLPICCTLSWFTRNHWLAVLPFDCNAILCSHHYCFPLVSSYCITPRHYLIAVFLFSFLLFCLFCDCHFIYFLSAY